jgi:hypothetical protein
MLSNLLSAKLAAAAAIAAFGIGTAAAATTGHLPGFTPPDHPPVSFVNASGTTTDQTSTTSSTTSTTADPTTTSSSGSSIPQTGPANQHALFGLCTAFLAGTSDDTSTSTSATSAPASTPAPSGKDNSTAFQALINETGGTPAATTTFCQNYVKTNHPGNPSTGNSTTTHGKPANTGNASDDTPGATAGPPSTVDHGNGPPASTPANGGGHPHQ